MDFLQAIPQFSKDILQFVKDNPMASLVLAGVSGTISYYAKSIPKTLWTYIKGKFLIEIKIDSSTDLYQELNQIILPHVAKANYRFFAVEKTRSSGSEEFDQIYFPITKPFYRSDAFGNSNKLSYRIVPGSGTFWFFHKGILYFCTKESKDSKPGGDNNRSFSDMFKPEFSLTLTAITRNRDKALSLLHDIIEVQSQPVEKISIYRHDSWSWDCAMPMTKRGFDTVILNDGILEEITEHIDTFISERETYRKLGTPYRYGLCLHGPTGTGKTSLVQALATHYRKDVYLLSLSAVSSDSGLQNLIHATSPGSIVLFEDVDSQGVDLRERTEDTMIKRGDNKEKITFSGILNAIDGLTTPEDRIFVYTTNTFEVFDSAFIRPGRMDHAVLIDHLNRPAQLKMAKLFFGETSEFVGVESKVSPAELKKICRNSKSASIAQQKLQDFVTTLNA